MKRVLVLGAQGMLGHDLVEACTLRYEVIGLSKEDLDITRQEATRKVIKEISPDVVINAAGYTDVDGCEKKMQKAFTINGEGSKNVAKGCRYSGAKLVYISTDYIFDGEKGSPYSEDDTPNPQNIYGESKLLGERYIEKFLDDYLIVRTQWLYGSHGRNFVETILTLAEETDRIEVVNDQVGSPTYTVDLSRAILTLLSKDLRGIFHVSNSGSCSWYEFALEILRLAGTEKVEIVPISSCILNRPAKRPLYSVFDCQRLRKEAGVDMRSWQEALQDYFNHRKG
ncbi:MAG: dTDP-4-dehydrorhamnose reductase [Deltaproteobacteria bacterium]|nr:MAG: dTDP-4-dehydrorhamnose reductase [Deltaproteobacteria bacterium]